MYQQCISLLQNQEQSTLYCLTLKLWNEPCAKRCPSKVVGEIGSLEEVEVHGYDIECLDMNRKASPSAKNNQPSFNCALYDLSEPFCMECQFARYSVSPAVELGL